MKDGKKVIATRYIEPALEPYDTFIDFEWARALSERTPPQLEDAVDGLCLSWKEAANTHRLPWLMVHQMRAFAEGLLRNYKPHVATLVGELNDWLRRELNGALKRADRKKVQASVKRIDQRLRIASQQRDLTFPAAGYWSDLIQQSEFQLSISGSQGQTYCAQVFAYEHFLTRCLHALGGDEDGWPSQKPFWTEWEAQFGRAGRGDYWDDRPVLIARETRNCIAHRGGRAKKKLKDLTPPLVINDDGIVCIQPRNNRELYAVLKGKVDRLVDEVKANLEGVRTRGSRAG